MPLAHLKSHKHKRKNVKEGIQVSFSKYCLSHMHTECAYIIHIIFYFYAHTVIYFSHSLVPGEYETTILYVLGKVVYARAFCVTMRARCLTVRDKVLNGSLFFLYKICKCTHPHTSTHILTHPLTYIYIYIFCVEKRTEKLLTQNLLQMQV